MQTITEIHYKWQVFLTCDDIKDRSKTTFSVVNAGAQ